MAINQSPPPAPELTPGQKIPGVKAFIETHITNKKLWFERTKKRDLRLNGTSRSMIKLRLLASV